jgi:hypothetical protein
MRGFILSSVVASVLFLSVGFITQIVSADSGNLFNNASAETAIGKLPQAWSPDSWGGTRATFTYASSSAQDGNRFLTTTVTKKAGGDAKWYPKHVSVTPGETYTFSDWYKSNTKTGVDIEYILSNGSYRYVHLADLASSNEWKKYETTFKAPARAKKLTILHYIERVGTLSVDNFSLTAGTTPPPPPPATLPTISSFIANPTSILVGSSSVLSWNVSNASSTSLSSIGAVTGGSTTVSPAQTTQYVLTATNPQGSVYATTTVTVTQDTSTPPVSTPSLTVTNSPTPEAQNILVNVSNQPLGGFVAEVATSSVTVSGMTFFIATSSTGSGLLTDIVLAHSNGTVYAGPVDATYDAVSGKQKITFTDTVTFPVGTNTFVLKGKIPSSFANGGTLIASTNPAQNWTSSMSLSTTTVVMNTMTIKTGVIAVRMSSTPAAQNVVRGTNGFTFAKVELDATGSGEDVRLGGVPVYFNTTGAPSNLGGCVLFDGATQLTTGSRVVNTLTNGGKAIFSLDNILHVTKNTTKTLAVNCNVSNAATTSGTYYFSVVNNTADWVVIGDVSTVNVVPTITAGNSAVMTVQNASLALSVDPSSPAYRVVSGGTTGQTVGVYKIRASNDTVTLNKLGLRLTSGSANDVTQVSLYNGATQIGTAVFAGGSTNATSTLSSPLTLPADTDVLVTIKADFADIGTGKPGTEGAVVKIDPANAEGTGSGGTLVAIGSGATAGVRVYNSLPTFSYSTTPGTLTSGVTDFLTLSATADSAGNVGLYKLNFQITTTTISGFGITNLGLIGPNGSVGTVLGPNISGVMTVLFDNPSNTSDTTIAAGTSKIYTLRGTVSNFAPGDHSSVSASLLGDSSLSSITTAVNVSPNNIVWSPLATTSLDINNNDWTNGHGLGGSIGSVRTLSN